MAIIMTALSTAFLVSPLPPMPRVARSVPFCAATDAPEEYVGAAFDNALKSLLTEARSSSVDVAVDSWLDRLDDNFIPSLGERLEAPLESDDVDELKALMINLKGRSAERFERAKLQLETLLEAGEINKLDAQL
eukprot:135689-Prymnesium_polylepis.1